MYRIAPHAHAASSSLRIGACSCGGGCERRGRPIPVDARGCRGPAFSPSHNKRKFLRQPGHDAVARDLGDDTLAAAMERHLPSPPMTIAPCMKAAARGCRSHQRPHRPSPAASQMRGAWRAGGSLQNIQRVDFLGGGVPTPVCACVRIIS